MTLSTINPTIPSTSAPLLSAPMRGNFQAAYNDINALWAAIGSGGGSGTVTSIAISGANGIQISGSPITTSGTIALTLGTITGATWNGVAIDLAHGGTGATTQAGAASAILPTQTSQSGKFLTTDGTNASWTAGGGGGTPGGSTTQVQYNNAGSFGGISGATTNGTALTLTAPLLGTPASGTLNNCVVTPTNATVARTLANHFNDQLYAKDFGAVGDGVTDDTAAIQLALDTMNTDYPNGAMLLFSRGTYVASQIKIYRQQILRSVDGPQACTLLQKAASNKDFIISENFATLTGTGANYGTNANVPSWFGIWDMHIDGNASNQGAGAWRCIAWYGNAQMMLGVNIIENAKQDNIYTEASGLGAYSATDWKAEEEGFFDHVISFRAGRYGWLNRGPHDSVIIDYIGRQNTSTGFRCEASGTTYTGTAHIHSIHTYAETDATGQYYGAACTIQECYTDYDNITFATQGTTIDKLYQIQVGFGGLNGCEVTAPYITIGTHIMDFYSAATNIIGCNVQSSGGNFVVGKTNSTAVPGTSGITLYKIRANFCSIDGCFSNASGAGSIGIDLNAAFCHIAGTSYGNTTALKYVAGNNNFVQLEDYSGNNATTTLNGTPSASDIFIISSDTGTTNVAPGFKMSSPYTGTGEYDWYLTSCMTGYFIPGVQTQITMKGAEANSAYDYEVPTTGFNIAIGLSTSYLLLNPAGTLATGAITMPAFPVDGHKVFIGTTATITALTVSPASGQTIKNAPSTLSAGSALGWIYHPADTTWYPILSNIVPGAAAGTLTGTTLAGTVVTSSLTTLGNSFATGNGNFSVGTTGVVTVNSGTTTLNANGSISAASGNFAVSAAGNITNFGAIITGGIQTFTTGATCTVAATDYIIYINKGTGSATAVTLPTSPATGRTLIIKDAKGDAATNNITLNPATGNIDGSTTFVININRGSVTISYSGTEWNVV